MGSAKRFEEVIGRLYKAAKAQSDSELARALQITPQSVAGARKRQEIPPAWIQSLAVSQSISADWLLFGEGSMERDGFSQDSSQVDIEQLATILEAVEEVLTAAHRKLSPNKKAQLISALYELYSEANVPVDNAKVLRLIKSVA
jgi:hypothetical protein